jgi:tyrosine-specific transport protein
MIRTNRLLGGILLVSGTSIGAGMLALPVITAFGGFFPSLALLAVSWLFLFTTSLLLLDVNLACPGEPNLITMVGRTLGTTGKMVCWVAYLLLLYSLTAAYIAGSAPLVLNAIAALTGLTPPSWLGPFPLLLLFATFVYLGTQAVDWMNRLFMMGLIASYLFLTFFLPSHIDSTLLLHVDLSAIWVAVPVVITSYGFHIIIPTLTTYLHHDIKKLRLTLLIGSLIPFFVYALWEFLILGIVPLQGTHGLIQAWASGDSSATSLSHILHNGWVITAANYFSFFAIITSFLGVSLSLADFLTDGLKIKRFSLNRELACLLTFLPPLCFVLTNQRGFLLALQFAGIFVVILLCILPALMAWTLPSYRGRKKRSLLLIVLLLSALIILLSIGEQTGMLRTLIDPYITHVQT